MPRIRSIKPEFPQSESIGRLSRDARLLFVQLWTLVDDDGRTRANSRMLASLLYPYDNDATKLIDKWLGELETNGHVRSYEAEGSRYLDIPKWLTHQKIDHPSKSKLPAFREASRELASIPEPLAPDLDRIGKDQDRNGSDSRAVAGATRTEVCEKDFEEFWKVYPKRDGANPKAHARKSFLRLIKLGVEAPRIIAAARECAAKEREKIGTPYIPQAVTWLNQQRFEDYSAPTTTGPPKSELNVPPWEREGLTQQEWREKELEKLGSTQGTEIRGNTGMGKEGTDQPGKLRLAG